MKKILTSLLLSLLFVSACDKLPENGDLDGMWQLTELSEAAADGSGYGEPRNMKSERIYWCVQLRLLSILRRDGTQNPTNGKTEETLCRFVHAGGSFRITEMYYHYRSSDELITDEAFEGLAFTGVHGNKAEFRVEKLNGKEMILCSDQSRLVFRKF